MGRLNWLFQIHDGAISAGNLCYNSANADLGEKRDSKETFTGGQSTKDLFLH
jgi:hypothetical protein